MARLSRYRCSRLSFTFQLPIGRITIPLLAIHKFGLKPNIVGNVRWIQREEADKVWYFITPLKRSSFNGKVCPKADAKLVDYGLLGPVQLKF